MTEASTPAPQRPPAWWLRDTAKLVYSIAAAAAGAILTGLQFLPDVRWLASWRGWATLVLFVVLLASSVLLVVVSAKDARDAGSLREQAAAGRELGYREAAAKLRRHIAKMRTRIASGVGPESADELRDSSIDVAQELMVGVGVLDARVSYYTPSAGEQEPGAESGDGYSALTWAYSSFKDGRHNPKSDHIRNKGTAKMFQAMTASAPVLRKRSVRGGGHWQTALFMGVRVGERPRGLVCADSLRRNAFPPAAHDLVQLIAELLLLAEFATTTDVSD